MPSTVTFLPDSASRLLKPLADLLSSWRGQSVAIGLSGGADSAMLTLCAAELAQQYDITLHCLHIHHGLMEHADDWQRHCQALVLYLQQRYASDVLFQAIAVQVDQQSGLGIEGAAREARYQAFLDYANTHQIKHFLLAHHLDDQAETLLLRLLRGSGTKGMQGMQAESIRHGYEVLFHRPWLGVERRVILELAEWFGQQTRWLPVQDESNLDVKYKRGVIRQHLTPTLNYYWPSWKTNLARYARVMEETQHMVDDLAAMDFASLFPSEDKRSFCLKTWRTLPAYRQSYVLRYWLECFHITMPTDKRLQQWLKQLREVHQLGFDRAVKLVHGNYTIVVRKGRVMLMQTTD